MNRLNMRRIAGFKASETLLGIETKRYNYT